MKKRIYQVIKLIFLTFILFSAGCRTYITDIYAMNKVTKRMEVVACVTQNTEGLAKFEYEGKKIEVDTRSMNFWQKNFVPIFQKTIETGQDAAVGAAGAL